MALGTNAKIDLIKSAPLFENCSKQELQYTGLSPRGWNGTRASFPQLLQVAV